MTAVLVHGVPETPAVWEPLRAHLRRADVAALELPGFGSPRPEGFAATKEAYVGWPAGELERADGPVDLVGHDWGGALVVRLVSTRPELVRSAMATPLVGQRVCRTRTGAAIALAAAAAAPDGRQER
jgi:pimeloyl-ACP methyl ester carboxylesterase